MAVASAGPYASLSYLVLVFLDAECIGRRCMYRLEMVLQLAADTELHQTVTADVWPVRPASTPHRIAY